MSHLHTLLNDENHPCTLTVQSLIGTEMKTIKWPYLISEHLQKIFNPHFLCIFFNTNFYDFLTGGAGGGGNEYGNCSNAIIAPSNSMSSSQESEIGICALQSSSQNSLGNGKAK